MSRPIKGKIVVKGELEALTPVSVGGTGASGPVDLELARNGKGNYYIPGTSLAGPIRAWLESNIENGAKLTNFMFGFQKQDQGHASHLFVEDAQLLNLKNISREIRNGVRIERDTGTAADKCLYSRAVLSKGTKISFEMELDIPDYPNPEHKNQLYYNLFEPALNKLINHIKSEGIRVGAGKTSGLGHLKLIKETVNRYNFKEENAEALFSWLKGRPPENNSALQQTDELISKSSDRIHFSIGWKAVLPVMVKAGYEGIETDILPLLGATGDGKLASVIPGSSLKGVIRSQCAKIVRTMMDDDITPVKTDKDNPDSGLPLIEDMFGSTQKSGRVFVSDVYQKQEILADSWYTEDSKEIKESEKNSYTHKEVRVAIDRFTGGAAEGALYSLRSPREAEWNPINLTIDFSRGKWEDRPDNAPKDLDPKLMVLKEENVYAELALVLLALRDIADGLLPVGFGTRRGMGQIKADTFSMWGQIGGKSLAKNELKVKGYLNFKQAIEENLLEKISDGWELTRADEFKVDYKLAEGEGQ